MASLTDKWMQKQAPVANFGHENRALDCGCGALQSILNAITGQIKWDSSRLIELTTTHPRACARAFVTKTLNYIFYAT